jgi:transcriptional regulator with XRE-family HTH domain
VKAKSKNVVGARIKQARLGAQPRITQNELVARLEILGVTVTRSGLSKIENGLRPLSDVEAVAFAKGLKVTVAWLFGDSDKGR